MNYNNKKEVEGDDYTDQFRVYYTRQNNLYVLFYQNQIEIFNCNCVNGDSPVNMSSICDSIQSMINSWAWYDELMGFSQIVL